MAAKTVYFAGVEAKAAPRTQKHRPAIWECMLGTVYALSPEGEVEYFDYDHKAAAKFAGINKNSDPRLHKVRRRKDDYMWIKKGSDHANPRVGRWVLWVLKKDHEKKVQK